MCAGMNGPGDEKMDVQMDGWVDGWMDGLVGE